MATDTLNTGRNIQRDAEANSVMDRKKYIGMNVLRTEDPVFLTGRAKYTDDIHLTGMLHCAFLRSPHPHAKITGIDKSQALAIDGVVAVMTEQDLEPVSGPVLHHAHARRGGDACNGRSSTRRPPASSASRSRWSSRSRGTSPRTASTRS